MNQGVVERRSVPSLSKASIRLKSIRMRFLSRRAEQQKINKIGSLVAKAELDHLDAQTLYGALLTIKDMTELRSNLNFWKRLGKEYMIPED
jgi:peptide deformylase